MAEVLVSSVGYDDSDPSDYESDNSYTFTRNQYITKTYPTFTKTYPAFTKTYPTFTKTYPAFTKKSVNSVKNLERNNLIVNNFNRNELKSPRFGLLNPRNTTNTVNNTENTVDSVNSEAKLCMGGGVNVESWEGLCSRSSLDTVDSLTPQSNENGFRWWRDEHDFYDSDDSNTTDPVVDLNSTKSDTREGANNIPLEGANYNTINYIPQEGATLLSRVPREGANNDRVPQEGAILRGEGANNIPQEGANYNTINRGGVEGANYTEELGKEEGVEDWKSWTVGTNQLQQLKSKLLHKLLNHTTVDSVDTVDSVEMSTHTNSSENELEYYKSMNRLLLDKLLYVLNNNCKLEYSVSNQYVTLIQQHLLKSQLFLQSLTNLHTLNGTTDSNTEFTPDTVDVEGNNEFITPTREGANSNTINYIPQEGANLLSRVPQEGANNIPLEGATLLTGGEGANSNTVNTVNSKVSEDRMKKLEEEKSELEAKLRVIEESKNTLEEDFKKTLTYMKLMKDRLKLFKHTVNNANQANTAAPTKPLTNTNSNNNNSNSNNIRRNNSVVRFKEMSELYVVPRSLSETRPIINNKKPSFFSKLFK